jgi:thiamine biosynthesis protein ThiS
MMTLEINGERRSVPPLDNLGELLSFLGVGQDRIAVEVNHRLISRVLWSTTRLADQDKVEIVQFVGGG